MTEEALTAKVAGAIAGRLNNEDRARAALKEIERCGYLLISQRAMDVLNETIAVLKEEINDRVLVQLEVPR